LFRVLPRWRGRPTQQSVFGSKGPACFLSLSDAEEDSMNIFCQLRLGPVKTNPNLRIFRAGARKCSNGVDGIEGWNDAGDTVW